MSNQLKSLNTNIESKNRKIKSIYKSMRKVRVYFQVISQDIETLEIAYQSDELTLPKAKKAFKTLTHTATEREKLLSIRPAKYITKLLRIQTGGYVGGIILSGHCDVIETVTV